MGLCYKLQYLPDSGGPLHILSRDDEVPTRVFVTSRWCSVPLQHNRPNHNVCSWVEGLVDVSPPCRYSLGKVSGTLYGWSEAGDGRRQAGWSKGPVPGVSIPACCLSGLCKALCCIWPGVMFPWEQMKVVYWQSRGHLKM